jgi:hypothetical protein
MKTETEEAAEAEEASEVAAVVSEVVIEIDLKPLEVVVAEEREKIETSNITKMRMRVTVIPKPFTINKVEELIKKRISTKTMTTSQPLVDHSSTKYERITIEVLFDGDCLIS